jgi:5-methylcytosine-specific restriction endonuclease McrA
MKALLSAPPSSPTPLRELPFGRPAGVPASPVPRGWRVAPPLFCPCGSPAIAVAGLCRPCYDRAYHSARRFDGLRFDALVRDAFRCRVCPSRTYLVVHHRQPGVQRLETMITLCASCHGVVTHQDMAPGCWWPPLLITLWREQHPCDILQTQFLFDDWTPAPPTTAAPTFGPAPAVATAAATRAPEQGALFGAL